MAMIIRDAQEKHSSISQVVQQQLNRISNHRTLTRENLERFIDLRKEANTNIASFSKILNNIQREHGQKIQSQVRDLNTSLNDLQNRRPIAQDELDKISQQLTDLQNGWGLPENTELNSLAESLIGLSDEISKLDREISSGEELQRTVLIDFESKSEDFATAATFHRSEARRLYWGIAILLIITVGTIYLAFLSANEFRFPKDLPPVLSTSSAAVVAVLLLPGAGKIALLFFLGWALKHLGELHKSHSEQAIIYLDRRAALGVAKNLLANAPDLQQKQELLRNLSAGYLNFEQNAFRSRAFGSQDDSSREELKKLKDLIDGVRGIFDSVKGIFEKAK